MFRPIAATFVKRAARVVPNHPLPKKCIPAALPPPEEAAV